MNFKGVDIKIDDGNELYIDPDCNFLSSRIHVQGQSNTIIINRALMHKELYIKIKGNNKKIVLDNSNKNIQNLKIVSIRGNGQQVFIGHDFGCGAVKSK